MELQGLQEALKVEIQCHQKLVAQMKQDPQDGELKKQLHERQTRITALSEKQKLAVRGCPVGNPKPLPLIKPPAQSIAISVLPAKAPVSMVTPHINGQKALCSEPLQTAPAGMPGLSRRAGEPPHSQMLGALTALPIKVPQVSSLHRLAVQAPALLPQVRPKSLIPDSLPRSPSQDPPSRPPGLHRVTAVISPRSQGPAHPTPNCTARPLQPLANGQPEPGSASISSAGVAYAIISASSSTGPAPISVSPAPISVSPASVSEAVKVIIIQPQAPGSSHTSPPPPPDSPARDAPPSPSPPAKKKREEDPEKIAFMVALGLVTTEHLEELQRKRQERKRRTTANPTYSGLFEPERKRLASHYLSSPLYLSARDTEDLCWKDDAEREEVCAVCKEDGELQPCHTCARSYHPDCLQPPLQTPPKGAWMCPKCQRKVLNKDLSWPQSFIQSYMTHKTVREEEKRRLMRRNSELKEEWDSLEEQDQRLSQAIEECVELKQRLMGQQREAQSSLERVKALIRLIQRDQVIQVTMTTTTSGASLLSLPWIKPSSTSTAPSVDPCALLQGLPLNHPGHN
ncbi:PHD finger protein 21B [Conger conger]|uniref:PHD finger protein 21B n=1 Tax=Conger conger TaxID=82655 RepID=UPI002A598A6D|nr:PHD finger protein 21B [Conger conger]